MGRGEAEDRAPLEGKFANFFRVGRNDYEIVIEFGQLYQGEDTPRMHSRIVTSPAYARALFETLRKALLENDQAQLLGDTDS